MDYAINAELNRDSAYKCNYVKNRAVFPETVLLIIASLPNGTGFGSGFFITPDGYAATNEHVVRGAVSISVKRSDGTFCAARVVAVDKEHDLAVLKVNAATCRFCEVEASGELPAPETPVAVFGYPLGSELSDTVSGMNISVTRGYVASTQTLRGKKTLVLDAELFHGSSGSAVVNAETGRVIGVHRAAFQDSVGSAAELTIPVQYLCAMFSRTAKNTDAATRNSTLSFTEATPPARPLSAAEIIRKAESGSAMEKAFAALCYRYGMDCEKSPGRAKALNMAAADAGVVFSMYQLGHRLPDENKNAAEMKISSRYAKMATEAGHILAEYDYASLLERIDKKGSEEVVAARMLHLCGPTPRDARQEKILAENRELARIAENTEKASNRINTYVNNYTEAMQYGNTSAMLWVGHAFFTDDFVYGKNEAIGYGHFLQGAKLNSTFCCVYTGLCCERGLGTQKNPALAAMWYDKALSLLKDIVGDPQKTLKSFKDTARALLLHEYD